MEHTVDMNLTSQGTAYVMTDCHASDVYVHQMYITGTLMLWQASL